MKWHANDKFAFVWVIAKYCQYRGIQNFAMVNSALK